MREKFINFAEKICSDEDLLPILKELVLIFEEAGMHHEEGACIEKMFNITKIPELYEEIGDVFLYKLRNRKIAKAAYDKYLSISNPKFYKKYANNLKQLGYDLIIPETENDSPYTKISNYCDRYNAIAYMIMYLHRKKDYQGVMTLNKYLSRIKRKIDAEKVNYPLNLLSCLNDVRDTDKHLSGLLATTLNNIEINKFAISLNPDNREGYFGVIGGYLFQKHYKDVIKFYNEEYAKRFKMQQCKSVPDICWYISDYYRDKFNFYMAIYFQKHAFEYELTKS